VYNNPSSVEWLLRPHLHTRCDPCRVYSKRAVWLQYYIASGVGHVHVKKLAYDVCKAVQLSDLDYEYIASGIKARDAAAEQYHVCHIYAGCMSAVGCTAHAR
jgi:hypothetical protein